MAEINKRKIPNTYEVIRIISKDALIINASQYQAKVGDKFSIYSILDEIIDIDGTSLGFYEYQKAIVTVVQVSPKFTICKNITTKKSPIFEIPLFSSEVSHEDLPVEEDEIMPLYDEINKNIIVGDLAKKC